MKKNKKNDITPLWIWFCLLPGLLGIEIFRNDKLFNVKDNELTGVLIIGFSVVVFLALTVLTIKKQ